MQVLPSNGWATAFSFLWGSATSVTPPSFLTHRVFQWRSPRPQVLCGYIGMMTAVKANVRVCVCCVRSSAEGFLAAFQGGAVMGFALCSIGLANLLILIAIMNAWLPAEADGAKIVPAFVGRFEVRCHPFSVALRVPHDAPRPSPATVLEAPLLPCSDALEAVSSPRPQVTFDCLTTPNLFFDCRFDCLFLELLNPHNLCRCWCRSCRQSREGSS